MEKDVARLREGVEGDWKALKMQRAKCAQGKQKRHFHAPQCKQCTCAANTSLCAGNFSPVSMQSVTSEKRSLKQNDARSIVCVEGATDWLEVATP